MSILRPSLDNLRSLGNFAQSFRWSLQFVTFPNAIAFRPTIDDLNFRAETTQLPDKKGEAMAINIRGHQVRQAGIYQWQSPLELTMLETVKPVVSQFVWEWDNLCWQSRDGSTGITEDQADLECDIMMYLLDNKDQPIVGYKMIGAFIEGSTMGELGSADAEPVKPQLSLAYQRVERDVL